MNPLYYSLDYNAFVRGAGDNTPVNYLYFQYGTEPTVDVAFVSNGALTVLPSGYNLTLGFKPYGVFETGDYVAFASTTAIPNTGAGDYFYQLEPNFYNSGVSGLIGNNASVKLGCQLAYDIGGNEVGMSPVICATLGASLINLNDSNYPVAFPFNSFAVSSLNVTGAGSYNLSGFAPLLISYVECQDSGYSANVCLVGFSGLNQILKVNVALPGTGTTVLSIYDTVPTGTPLYYFSGNSADGASYLEATYTGAWQILNVGTILSPNFSYRVC